MTIKVYQQNCFSVVAKNLNWELFTLKDGMGGLRIKNFTVIGAHWRIKFLVVFTKNQYIVGLPIKEGLGQFADLRGGLKK